MVRITDIFRIIKLTSKYPPIKVCRSLFIWPNHWRPALLELALFELYDFFVLRPRAWKVVVIRSLTVRCLARNLV